jgi:hypothetical protein
LTFRTKRKLTFTNKNNDDDDDDDDKIICQLIIESAITIMTRFEDTYSLTIRKCGRNNMNENCFKLI